MKTGNKLIVAAATYNRPRGLSFLLDEMEKLRFPDGAPDIEMVIVDNSVDANAEAAVRARARTFRWPLHYAHESQRGITAARNRALVMALQRGSDWMAFIDDDEYPDPVWLDRMIARARVSEADVVVGTVKPSFDQPPAQWMIDGGFFAIDRFGDGQTLDFGNTSNVLFNLRFARETGLRFDRAFGLTGGEDTYFFHTMLLGGGQIVFSGQGVVYETIVPQRARFGWLLQRWCRSGNTDGRILMRVDPGLRSRLVKAFGGGVVRLLVGAGLMVVKSPLALVGQAHKPAKQLQVAARGFGFILSAFGRDIEEYKALDR